MNFQLTPQMLSSITRIITHADCPDGIASAMILHDALPDAAVEFIQYNTPERHDLVATPGMLFCDMTPPPERVQEFVAAGAIVLDHHKGAEDIVAAFGERGVFADDAVQSDGSMSLVFSLRSCGADILSVAKANGGGGHTGAAGFSVPLLSSYMIPADPITTFERCLPL